MSFFIEMIRRVSVLEDRGPLDSIRGGWHLIAKRFLDVFLMWLILVGVRIGYFVVAAIVTVVLLLLGGLVGGSIGVILYFAVNAFSGSVAAWVSALSVGGLLLMLIVGLPMIFLGGMRETFISSTWTLAYREIVFPPAKEVIVAGTGADDAGDKTSQMIQ